MKYLPAITFGLWSILVIGYFFANEMILQPIVFFPIFIIFSIFIPISFWNLQAQNKKILPLLLIAIFFVNLSWMVYGLYNHISVLKMIDHDNEEKIDPQLASLLVIGESLEERETTSRIIYEKHGVALPFKAEGNIFNLYSPTKSDEVTFEKNQSLNFKKSFYKNNAIYQISSFFLLLAIHIGIFLALLVYLILFDKSMAKKVED